MGNLLTAVMLHYRTFRNTDPPKVAELWQSRGDQRGLVQPVSVDLLEQFVFGRLYFDYEGLFLAWDDQEPLGFAHAAFGPNEQENALTTELGVVSLLLVRPECDEPAIAGELLKRCEDYLHRHGAKVLYGGGIRPLNPFYLGLYGGSELPGILQSDCVALELFRSHGYQEIDRTVIFHVDLHRFRAPINRRQMQIRRRMMVQVTVDPPSRNWWEACTTGCFDLTRYDLVPRGGTSIGHATVRSMDSGTAFGPARSVGLIELEVAPGYRRQGLTTFLLTETFHQLARQGIARVEVQTMAHNQPAVGLYRKLGFKQVEQGVVFRKEA